MAGLKKLYKQTIRRWTRKLRRRKILNRRIEDLLTDNCKLHIGCGEKKLKGYINIDIVPTEGSDVVLNTSKELHRIPSNIAIEIRMENSFEHFYRYEQKPLLRQFNRILKKEGRLILIGIPDFDAIIDGYLKKKIARDKPIDLLRVYTLTHGDPRPDNSPQQLHKDIFTEKSAKKLLADVDFRIVKLSRGDGSVDQGLSMSIEARPIK